MRAAVGTLLLFSGFALFTAQAHAEKIDAVSRPIAATVFSDRATVTREAKIEIPEGAHTIVFKGLPLAISPDSLRVEGEGSTKVILGALSHKTVNEADFVNEQVQNLNLRLENLRGQKNILNAEKTALSKQHEFYESLKAQASDRTREEISEFKFNTEQWISAADTIMSGLEKSSKGILEKNELIGNIDKQVEKIIRDLDQLRATQKSSIEVSIPVEANNAGNLTLNLSYQIGGATWKPVYDARLDTKSGALKITQYGAVRQNTGEDWDDIALTLSTARPQRGVFLPEPEPIWVDIARNFSGNAFSSITTNMSAGNEGRKAPGLAMMDSAYEEAPLMKEDAHSKIAATIAPAQIETGDFTAEYKIPALNSVPPDGTESKLLIGEFETDNTIETHVQPQFSTNAYLVARATLKGENPILPGSVNLFLDGAYVGQSHLPLLRAGKDTRLSFGIDDQVEIKRQTLKDETGESGIIIGMQNVVDREYNTEIRNLRKKPVNLVLLETIPTPKNEKITVEILKDKTTSGFEKDAEKIKGLMRWHLELRPGEKKDVALGWKISWPKDLRVDGLPR